MASPRGRAGPARVLDDAAGEWFVIHSYAGYEKRVKANLERRRETMNLEDRIFQVEVPEEEVWEFRQGREEEGPPDQTARLRPGPHGPGRRDLGRRAAHPGVTGLSATRPRRCP